MITNKDNLRYAKLIHVSVDNGTTTNSNKVYIMQEQADGRIKCEYGRVGATNLRLEYKNSSEWDKVYKSKLSKRKNYKDVTDMITEKDETADNDEPSKMKDIEERLVKELFSELMMFANKSIQKNYKVTQESVTEAQIDAAQAVLTKAVKTIKLGMDVQEINDLLIELYTIIPRKMNDVRDYLVTNADTNANVDWIKNFVSNEQDTLDTMSGQVKLLKQQKLQKPKTLDSDVNQEIDLLEQMGLSVTEETDDDALGLIYKLLGRNKHQAKKIFKCVNNKTQKVFDVKVKTSKNKKRRLYFHGSRNENVFNIIQTGLSIRPSGVVHTGSMFSDGIYFASKAQKSLGYTSLNGSYWASGNSNKGYLMIFDVLVGNQKNIYKHDRSCYHINNKDLLNQGFNSVYAHGGADLRNDEFIIYDPKQCTMAYLIEMSD